MYLLLWKFPGPIIPLNRGEKERGGEETDKSKRERGGGEVKGECGRERGSEKLQQIIMR